MLVYDCAADLSTPSSNVLDVGTKNGQFLSGIDGTVVALDIFLSPSVSWPEFLRADGCMMPFPDDTFDIVISNQVFEHVSPEQRDRMLDEIARVLRPTGEFLISVPNRYFPHDHHNLPLFWSALPRSLCLGLGRHVLRPGDHNYYRTSLYPISPWRLRTDLERRFEDVSYDTLRLGERYGENVWPDWFMAVFPIILWLTTLPGVRTAFEYTFGYVAYRCRIPRTS